MKKSRGCTYKITHTSIANYIEGPTGYESYVRYCTLTLCALIGIFINLNEKTLKLMKNRRKIMGYTYIITHISLTYCPRVLDLISKQCYDIVLLPYGKL